MQATVKRWVRQETCDIGTYQTTVTFCTPVLMALTFPGRLTRREALVKAFHTLQAEGRWSPDFLRAVKALSLPKR